MESSGAHSEIRGAIFLWEAHSEMRGAHSCPPRGWTGAGVGVGMLRGRGVLGFLVSWFQSVLVSWFQSFLFSKFQRFTKLPCHVFWEILIPISKIFKNLLDGSSGLIGAKLSKSSDFKIMKIITIILFNMIGDLCFVVL